MRRLATVLSAAIVLAHGGRSFASAPGLPPPDPPPGEAPMPEAPSPRWGLHNGETAGHRGNLIFMELGWPDASIGYLRGVTDRVDIGIRTSLIYGVNFTATFNIGFAAAVPFRFGLYRSEKVSFLVHVDPGVRIDYFSPEPFAGPQLPIGFEVGVHLTPRTTFTIGADMPLSMRLTPDFTVLTPLLMGVGLEGHVTERFALFLNTRAGAVHGFGKGGSATAGGFLLQGGFAVRP
jgi:hypothetical protein